MVFYPVPDDYLDGIFTYQFYRSPQTAILSVFYKPRARREWGDIKKCYFLIFKGLSESFNINSKISFPADQNLSQIYLPLLLNRNVHDDQPPRPQRCPPTKIICHKKETTHTSIGLQFATKGFSAQTQTKLIFSFRACEKGNELGGSVMKEQEPSGGHFRAKHATVARERK